MKKIFLTLVAVVLIWAVSFAQYRKMPVFELACDADLIVMGRIASLDPLKFNVEISQVIAGEYEGSTVGVNRFLNTKVAKRWSKYIVGEQVILFLRKDGGAYKILGEGGEGEKLIMGEEVCIDSRGEGLKNRFGYHATANGANIYAEKVPLNDFIGGVQDVKKCVSVTYLDMENGAGVMEKIPTAKLTCTNEQKDEVYSKSWVHSTIMEQAEKVVK